MNKSGVDYSIEQMNAAIQIETSPDKNELTQKSIEISMGKDETCINSIPGKFNVIQTDIKVYKITVEQNENIES